jgi:CobQ-like glutamine amidotransferase family enzyme
MQKNYSITIGWLYPDLMSTYGDRGNIIVLQKRCEWRGISVEILPIEQLTTIQKLKAVDLIFGGGAQDREQEIVMSDLKSTKGDILRQKIDDDIPALFVCGSPQLMGKYYEPAVGKRIEGLGVFDMETTHPGADKPRLIGNVIAEVKWNNLQTTHTYVPPTNIIVGFENHGGRTVLGKNSKPFATVIKGFGNNGNDHTEGVVYHNAIGCYFHGPFLPKNPHIADFLITKALEVKYQEEITLHRLDDSLEMKAQSAIAKRMGVTL